MKTKVYTVAGNAGKEITLPKAFSEVVRETLIQKIVEAKKNKQPYGPKPLAGMSYSASGKLKHHRKVWKSQYGRGMSRVPRKIMTRRGSQFYWIGATSPNTRGGRRAHPPKVDSMINLSKLNKKELRLALRSALSATASPKWLVKRYETLSEVKDVKAPYVVESKFVNLKTKDKLKILEKILGEKLFSLAVQKKSVRKGIGKLRGRKYKKNLGLLLVIGKDEKTKVSVFDVKTADTVGVVDLAKGGPGRLTVYTEQAIKDLEERIK